MKKCPKCGKDYFDDTLSFCLDDGTPLLASSSQDEASTNARTAILGSVDRSSEAPTRLQPGSEVQTEGPSRRPTSSTRNYFVVGVVSVAIAAALSIGGYFMYYGGNATRQIESVAVMPFINESSNPDVEYLSDGMTESLINSLSQLPKLNVKSRSYVFPYKGKQVSPQTVGREISVQALLYGRIVQRAENLTLYLSLVDASTGNQLWGEQYDRKMADLVSLQGEIARDVSRKLGARLSGVDERKLGTTYTANPEAYQNYLRGRYHTMMVTRPELLKAIPYYQKAIEIDPNYALAYVGLADAYRGLPLAGEMNPQEYFPKAKASALKALEIDDRNAEAYAVLGWIIYWYDWDWAQAEKNCRRAVELDPGSSDAHMAYAHVLSSMGRHAEAIAEARTAREIEPLNVRTNTLEAQFLIHAGRPDEALERLRTVIELDPDYWFAYQFQASAFLDKGLYEEAAEAGKKGMASYPANTRNASFTACALAKLGRMGESRELLAAMLAPQEGKFLPPYNIAVVYNCQGDKQRTIEWLRRGIELRDPRMTFLRSEQKWNNLRDDPQFRELIGKMGFPQ